jgi:serine/threonine protein kinase
MLPAQSVLHKGRFQVLARIGSGGMGAVYKALDLQLNRRIVAIKEMSQSGLTGKSLQQAISTFTREAEMLSHLRHPSLPHIYAQFEENERQYLVMEFIEGETLEEHLESIQAQGNLLSPSRVIEIGRQLCSVLDYLHTRQPPIIFRDLKPSNIMLNTEGQVYLIDFGIARWFAPDRSKDTVALGSSGYAPPEQYRQASSPRSDIYSLGATLHQLLTGDDPAENPFSFRPFSVNLPRLEQLVLRMVALDEKQRPATMYEVQKTLDELIIRPGSSTARVTAPSQPPPMPSSLSLAVVVSSTSEDHSLWKSLHTQLVPTLQSFPQVSIETASLASGNSAGLLDEAQDTIDRADLILLMVSEDFLASPACMDMGSRALDRRDTQQTQVYAVLLRPCLLESRLSSVKVLANDPLTHPSLYVREQRSLVVAREIRSALVSILLAGKRGGPMNLLQWLLCQLYSSDRSPCPYFTTGGYVVKYMRRTSFTGIYITLFDRQKAQELATYRIGPIQCPGLQDLLQSIGLSQVDPANVRGIASWKSPFNSYAHKASR